MFLAVDVALLRHPKTMKLRRALMDRRAALYVVELWAWCSEFATDGDLTQFDPLEIEEGVGWSLDAGVLFAALVASGFIDKSEDGRITVHDWMSHQGKWIAKMEAERTRLKEWRSGRRKSDSRIPEDTDLVETVMADGKQTVIGDNDVRVQREDRTRTRTVRVREHENVVSVRANLTKPNLTKEGEGESARAAPIRPARAPRAPMPWDASLPFLRCFERYPNGNAKAKAACVWQALVESFEGGEAALEQAIAARFDAGMLKQHPYSGEARFRPTFESFLAERRWEDPESAPDQVAAKAPSEAMKALTAQALEARYGNR